MNFRDALLPGLAFTALTACTSPGRSGLAPQPERSERRDADAAEVERFFMEGIGHFNGQDLDRFLAQFDDDIRMFAVSSWLRGKPALRQRFAATFKQFPQTRMQITNLRGRSEARGVVTVEFQFHVFPRGTGPAYHGVGSGLYVRTRAGWREVLEHETVTRKDAGL